MQPNASFLTMLEHPSVLKRLLAESKAALIELWNEPRVFITSAINGDRLGRTLRTQTFRLGLSAALLIYVFGFVVAFLLWSVNHQGNQSADRGTLYIRNPLRALTLVKLPDAESDAGGGGGGGRKTITLPSKGDLPLFALTTPIIAPTPEEPLRPPVLPVFETVKVDPRILVERDNLIPTGLPDGVNVLPSAGPGTGGGIGTGPRGGIGEGDGLGVGPGSDDNMNGGRRLIGGRPRQDAHQDPVDSRPVLLNNPQPLFTEMARKNKIQGVVKVRILVDSGGSVREVVLMRGLPDGLNEQAIRAAYQMRFRPAIRNGQLVSYWMNNVLIEFNLR
jgi:protein TonB